MTTKAQLDQSDELGWVLDRLLKGDLKNPCPKAIARAHARLLSEREALATKDAEIAELKRHLADADNLHQAMLAERDREIARLRVAITESICDACWGTGSAQHSGIDLRKLESQAHQLAERDKEIARLTDALKRIDVYVRVDYTDPFGSETRRALLAIVNPALGRGEKH